MSRLSRLRCGLVAALCLLTACAAPPKASDYTRTASYALKHTADTRLGKAYAKEIGRHPGQSGFHLLPNGPEALMMRIALVEASQRSIDIQYFSTQDDTTGELMLEAILRAAGRGVRVRMLLDDWNLDDFEAGAVALSTNPNIEIRIFNPYATRDQSIVARAANVFSYLGRYTRRMHNKAIIFDNQAAIMGGRNIGDEYFDAGKQLNLRDVDAFAVGPIVSKISANFDRYWNSNEAFPLRTLALPPTDSDTIADMQEDLREHWGAVMHSHVGRRLKALPLPHEARKGKAPLVWADAELVADLPHKVNQDKAASAPGKALGRLVNHAHSEFIMFTPYFVPMERGVKWLDGLVARGVRVRIVTNSLASTDMVPAEAGYSHYREALVEGGVELYEIKSAAPRHTLKSMFKPSSQNGLHAKVYVIDRRDMMIGSFNFDPRSVHLNTEQVLVIHSPALCAQAARLFTHMTAPVFSYHIIPARDVPAAQRPMIHGALAWETKEHGTIVYYDFNPHAGFWRTVTGWFFSLLPIDNEL